MFSQLLDMDIVYNVHASNRTVERELLPSLVKEIIDDPSTECEIQQNGRLKFENKGLVIIGEVRKSRLWIVTVFPTSRKEEA